MDKKPVTVAEAGRLGGRKTASTHGKEHYKRIGSKGGCKVAAERGSNFFSEIGKQGGAKRAKQHEGAKEAQGKVSIEEAAQRGGQRTKRLIEVGKKHEKEHE